jgi:autotransporter translocation and assembly factor TamB
MTARGEIRLTQGFYGGYGLSLRIDRGRFTYSGGPVDNPALDILALRRSDDVEKLYNVKVGVAIFGTLKHPNVKLYSQPLMKDEEILSFLILARPYDPQKGNLSLLVAGAGGLRLHLPVLHGHRGDRPRLQAPPLLGRGHVSRLLPTDELDCSRAYSPASLVPPRGVGCH